MTKQDIPRNSSIDRRTVLGLLSGSLAALAGCSGGLSDSSDGGDGSAGPPEEQSDYIEETKIKVVRNNELALEVAVTDDIDPSSVSIITESGREFSSDYFSSGETRTSLLLTEGDDNNEPLPRGQHTLYFRGDGVETEIPLELGTTFELEKVVPATEHPDVREGLGHLVVVVRNVGERTGAATRALMNGKEKEDVFVPVEPGETNVVRYFSLIEDTVSSCPKADESAKRDEQLTVEFLWSDPVTFTQTISYENSSGCERTLIGTPEEVTATSVETETETET
ncbi:hypothetical protein [Haloarcula sp. Atlit-120R]|uniref:hypothetical protein n=1 Tax=Haloarcula sp. Atlit-120R TaxID=2282135 RepID=UPI000EF1E311|nr:hypothetical protein [Haloarcula sp. Atlit-120R]RLM33130.1 hypothetical protein DVK01_18215 [Haloarcula sp. Atlit-120R]